MLFKHKLGNKALWKWPEPGAGASQGVKSTVTGRILRFVILPVTALKGVHIPEGMKLWERLVLNAKSPFRQSFTMVRGSLAGAADPGSLHQTVQASGPGFSLAPRAWPCCVCEWDAELLNKEEQVRRTDMKERLKGVRRKHPG